MGETQAHLVGDSDHANVGDGWVRPRRGSARESILFAAIALMPQVLQGCTSPDGLHTQSEDVGVVSSPLLDPQNNVPIGHTFNHETSVTYVAGAGAPPGTSAAQGRWVAAAINVDTGGATKMWSWMYSTDGNGSSWTLKNQQTATEFGSPPGNSPSTGGAFVGWLGDPSVAAVTSGYPGDWSNGGKRVVGVSLAKTTFDAVNATDVIVALSEDGGETWGNVQWVNTATSGYRADFPFVFSDPTSSDVYVSWKATNAMGEGWGYLRKIKFGLPPSATFDTTTVPFRIKKEDPLESVAQISFGIGSLPQACSSGQKGIFAVYTNLGARCPQNGQQSWNQDATWKLRIYDIGGPNQNPDLNWYGPFGLGTVPSFSTCVGSPLSAAYSNTQVPRIAVDPLDGSFWVTHTTQETASSAVRVKVHEGVLVCGSGGSGGGGGPSPQVIDRPWNDQGLIPPNGGDQWLPAIAMTRSQNFERRVALFWYGTLDSANNEVALFAAYKENSAQLQGPYQISTALFPVAGAASWPVYAPNSDVWDYQTLGVSWTHRSFLALWAGDRRNMVIPGWNGGFETGQFTGYGSPSVPTGDWVPSGAQALVIGAGALGSPHSGSYQALLGSTSPTLGDSTVTQQFTAPYGATTVSFWYNMTCPDTNQYDWIAATLHDDTTLPSPPPVVILPAGPGNGAICTQGQGWQQTTPVAVVPGRKYTITIANHDDAYPTDPSYTLVDDLSFGTSSPISMMSALLK
jgi:hypothetical protein